MAKTEKKPGSPSIANRKAWHEYSIEDTFEAGLSLVGTEVKSLRLGKASLQEAYCKIENGEVFIYGMHIAPYEQGNRFNVDPIRKRKVLLHASEIQKLDRQLKEKGYTLIPLKLYFTRGFAKLQIGLGKGKKLYDKRDSIAEKDTERQRQREVGARE